MSGRTKTVLAGAFTFGALALLVAIILVFGADRLLRETTDCVLYFEGSVAGLDVGAPVIFRGVEIGAVKEIKLVYDPQQDDFRIPVILEIYKGTARQTSGEPMMQSGGVKVLVAKGLRAKLASQSLLTGKLNVSLDFYTDTELRIVADNTGLPQIPTIPTTLEAFANKLASLPLEEIVQDLRKAMQGVSDLVSAEETSALPKSLNEAVVSTRKLIDALNSEFVPVAKSLNAIASAARQSLEAATEALLRVEESMDANAPLRHEFARLMEAMKDAAKNVAELTSALEHQPESILRGKRQKERYP